MTRLATPRTDGTFDLAEAFRVLGNAPDRRRLGWVIRALRERGIEPDYSDTLVEVARANGSSAYVALDLVAAFWHGVDSLAQSGPRARHRG